MTHFDKFLSMFQGPSGGYDTARILFGIGGLNGLIAPVVFLEPKGVEKWCAGEGPILYGEPLARAVSASTHARAGNGASRHGGGA